MYDNYCMNHSTLYNHFNRAVDWSKKVTGNADIHTTVIKNWPSRWKKVTEEFNCSLQNESLVPEKRYHGCRTAYYRTVDSLTGEPIQSKHSTLLFKERSNWEINKTLTLTQVHMYMHVYIHVHIDKQDAYTCTYMHSTHQKNFLFPCSFYTVIFLRVLGKKR